jgi:hypothetical protein
LQAPIPAAVRNKARLWQKLKNRMNQIGSEHVLTPSITVRLWKLWMWPLKQVPLWGASSNPIATFPTATASSTAAFNTVQRTNRLAFQLVVVVHSKMHDWDLQRWNQLLISVTVTAGSLLYQGGGVCSAGTSGCPESGGAIKALRRGWIWNRTALSKNWKR